MSHSPRTEVVTFNSSVLSPCFGRDQCTPAFLRELTEPYVLYIDSHLSLTTDSREYYQWDLGRERPRDCSVLELCRNICILQQTFHCCIGLSHPDECFWFFGIRWLTYDCLWSGDLTDDTQILKVLHHCKGILDRKMHNKCSVFKIRREQLTCWHVENEFRGQKHGYETDHLKNNLQLELFDRVSKPSGFIWLSWIHISFFFSNSCWSNQFQALSDRLCLYQERLAQSWG